MIMARSMSQTTERLNLWSANDFVLARWGFVRFIALRCMFIWCFVSTCKTPSSNSVYKIPCKNDLREIFDDCSLPSHWGFSIKNPTIESEVSWSSLLSFLHFRRTEFTTTRMLSHVKNIYSVFRRRNTVLMALCEYRLNGGSKPLSIWYANYSSRLDKRSQCHTRHRFWWSTIVIKVKMVTVTWSCISRALCLL